jgi:hypothetical protein
MKTTTMTDRLFIGINYALLILICGNLIACGGAAHMGDYATISGTPEGIKALGDTLIGMQQTAKTDSTQYFNQRNVEVVEYSKRAMAPSFLQQVLGK